MNSVAPSTRASRTALPMLATSITALPGVGPWTADYVRMRVTGDPDVLLPGDVALRAGAAALGISADARGVEAWALRCAPWRSYLSAHLWRAAPTGRTPKLRTDSPEGTP